MPNNDTHVILYAEHTEDPASWRSPRPDFDAEQFSRELERRGGMFGSVPRFRLRWGGDLDECCIEEFAELTGYDYLEDGIHKFVSCNNVEFEFPDGCVPAPHYEYTKVYIPRWLIERYDGELKYELAWTVERLEKVSEKAGNIELISHYREPAEVDLEIASGVRSLSETLTPEDISAGLARKAAATAKELAEKKEEIKQDNNHWADKYARDGVKSPVFSIPKNPAIKNISKELREKL